MKTSLKFLAIPLAVGALFFAGCGSDDSSDDNSSNTEQTQTQTEQPDTNAEETTGAGTTLELTADPSGALAYEQTELTAKPGQVTIEFTNQSPMSHDVVIEDSNGEEVGRTEVFQDGTESVEFTAEKGTYTYYCSVPGHEAMTGTLTVK